MIELIIVIIIISVLAATATASVSDYVRDARFRKLQADLNVVKTAVEGLYLDGTTNSILTYAELESKLNSRFSNITVKAFQDEVPIDSDYEIAVVTPGSLGNRPSYSWVQISFNLKYYKLKVEDYESGPLYNECQKNGIVPEGRFVTPYETNGRMYYGFTFQ